MIKSVLKPLALVLTLCIAGTASAEENAAVSARGYLVIDAAAQAQTIVKQRPASLTGGATSISFDIGAKIRDKGLEVLAPAFAEGLQVSETPQGDGFNLTVRNDGFTYKYDSLSGLGFTVTPRVTFSLTAELFAPDGTSLFRKTYPRENFDAGAYVASFKPKQKVIGAFEAVLIDIYTEVLADIKASESHAESQPMIAETVPAETVGEGAVTPEPESLSEGAEAIVTEPAA